MNTNLNIRLFVIECIKARRSGFYPIVVGAPLIIFLCYILYFYYTSAPITEVYYYYVITLTIISPIIFSCSLYIPFEIEKKCCQGKEIFSSTLGMKRIIVGKIYFTAIIHLCILIFFISIYYIFAKIIGECLPIHFLYVIPIIFLGELFLFLSFIFLILILDKNIVILIGMVCTILNGILMTKLGNGIWFYFPCSWSVILSHLFLISFDMVNYISQIYIMLFKFSLYTIIFYLIFRFWLLDKSYNLIENNYRKYCK